MPLPEELEAAARAALLRAFIVDFDALVNAYVFAAEGLDVKQLTQDLQEYANVYDADPSAVADAVAFYTRTGGGSFETVGHETLTEALDHQTHDEVYLNGKLIFKKVDGNWEPQNED